MQLGGRKSSLKVLLIYYMFLIVGLLFVIVIPFIQYPLNLIFLFMGFVIVCIGIHELAHFLVAIAKGYRIVKPTAKWYSLGFEIQPAPRKEDAAMIYLSSLVTCFVIPPIVFYFFGLFWGLVWFFGTLSMASLDVKSWRASKQHT